jgi:hypothetical protein
MRTYRFIALILLAALVPALGDLVDMGFLNGRAKPVDLVLEYNTGRRSDMHLQPYEAVLDRGLPGEVLTRIHINGNGRGGEILLASKIRETATYRGAPWLYISDRPSRVIPPQEMIRLSRRFPRR